VAEVGNGGDAESALRALDEKGVPTKLSEDRAEVLKMIRPRLAVDQYIVKENEHKATKEEPK
jgi:hypothetical protein